MAAILMLTQVLPYPLDAGPKVRAYHMLRHLSGRHQVTLVSFTRCDDPPEAADHLSQLCHAIHQVPIRRSVWRNIRAGITGLATGLPIVIVRDESAAMVATLRQVVSETAFDVIHADQLSMAAWGLLARRFATGDTRSSWGFAATLLAELRAQRGGPTIPRTVLDEHNAIYMLTRRMAAEEANPLRRAVMDREAGAFARYEAAICRAYDAVLAVTREDREHLLALEGSGAAGRRAEITVIPICVDADEVRPVQRVRDWADRNLTPASALPPGIGRSTAPVILHLGTMFWPPNVAGVLWFAREVLPLVWQAVPDARFVIVGKNPPPEVRALAADDARIIVTGYVADPAPYLAASDVFVVPLHAGGGMRVKILDAWLWGQPVVATPVGAEGIEVRDGENILLAAGAPAFAAAVVRVLTDATLNAALRANGRAWVEAHYSWQSVYRQVDALYAALLSSPSDAEQLNRDG